MRPHRLRVKADIRLPVTPARLSTSPSATLATELARIGLVDEPLYDFRRNRFGTVAISVVLLDAVQLAGCQTKTTSRSIVQFTPSVAGPPGLKRTVPHPHAPTAGRMMPIANVAAWGIAVHKDVNSRIPASTKPRKAPSRHPTTSLAPEKRI
jgi:hypothetical protein